MSMKLQQLLAGICCTISLLIGLDITVVDAGTDPEPSDINPNTWNGTWRVTSKEALPDSLFVPGIDASMNLQDVYTISEAVYNDTIITAKVTEFSVSSGFSNGSLRYDPVGRTLSMTWTDGGDRLAFFYNDFFNVSISSTANIFTLTLRDARIGYTLESVDRDIVTGIEVLFAVPTEFQLSQNYPNPFNPTTTIEYQLPSPTQVTLAVYNALGQLVKELVDKNINEGRYTVTWDGTNNQGKHVSTGVYIYRLQTSQGFIESRKMLLLK